VALLLDSAAENGGIGAILVDNWEYLTISTDYRFAHYAPECRSFLKDEPLPSGSGSFFAP
jgi:hypothetical protein